MLNLEMLTLSSLLTFCVKLLTSLATIRSASFSMTRRRRLAAEEFRREAAANQQFPESLKPSLRRVFQHKCSQISCRCLQ